MSGTTDLVAHAHTHTHTHTHLYMHMHIYKYTSIENIFSWVSDLAEDIDRWRALMNAVMNLWVP